MPDDRVPPLAVSPRRYRPLGPVRGGWVRPMRVVPGAENPWVRMGGDLAREEIDRGLVRSGVRIPGLGALSAEELDRGAVVLDNATGDACVLPGKPLTNAIAPFYVNLRPSGSRGVPLSVERPLAVRPLVAGTFEQADMPVAPSTDLTRVWPQLFPPGRDGGERPRTVASASTVVGAGATVTLVSLPELGRGIGAAIKKFGQTANDFTNLVWSFVVKGATVDPISGISFQFGALNDPVDLPGSGVLLAPGDDFLIVVTNTGGVAVTNVRARVDLYEYRMTG